MDTQYSFVSIYCNFFIHSSVDGYLSCFHVLAIVNCAEVSIAVHVYFSILLSLEYTPSSGIAGSYVGFIPNFFKEISIPSSIVAVSI